MRRMQAEQHKIADEARAAARALDERQFDFHDKVVTKRREANEHILRLTQEKSEHRDNLYIALKIAQDGLDREFADFQ